VAIGEGWLGGSPEAGLRRITQTLGASAMAKKKPKRTWVWATRKPTPPTVPDDLKAEVEAKANVLIREYMVPTLVKPPPEDKRWNYLTGITTKWHRSFFYLVGHYASPGPDAISSTFESRFARMEYAGGGRFHLAYFRHTGKWWEVYRDLTPDVAINTIRNHGIFHPT